ncbi:MAG: GerW family sporulation protein [Clostridiales bacterium]|nr:GerW family sporulation protein [Clostridiales bacterium]
MAENFQDTVASLFKGMDSFITTKTVVGDPITVGDTIILPLVDVSFGVAASAKAEEKKNAGGGMGGKISPSAVLVISNGTTKLVNVKNQDAVTKVLDMVPDIVNKFMPGQRGEKASNPEVDEAMQSASEQETTFCSFTHFYSRCSIQ